MVVEERRSCRVARSRTQRSSHRVKDNYNNVKTGEFNDTTIAEFVSTLQQHVSSLQKDYGGAQGYNLTDSLLSFADFLESYRQMRGP